MLRMLASATPVSEAVEPLMPASHSLASVSGRLESALIPESKPKEEAAARCDTRPGNRIPGQARSGKASAEASKSSVLYIGNHGGEIRMVEDIFSRSSELERGALVKLYVPENRKVSNVGGGIPQGVSGRVSKRRPEHCLSNPGVRNESDLLVRHILGVSVVCGVQADQLIRARGTTYTKQGAGISGEDADCICRSD